MKLQLLDHVEINGVTQPEGMVVELEDEQAQPLLDLGAAKKASNNAKVGHVVKPRTEDDDDAAAKKAETVVAEAEAKAAEIVSDAEKAENDEPVQSTAQNQGQNSLKGVPQKDK